MPFGVHAQTPLAFAVPVTEFPTAGVEQPIMDDQDLTMQEAAADNAVAAVTTKAPEESSVNNSRARLAASQSSVIKLMTGACVHKILAEAVVVKAQLTVAHLIYTHQVSSHITA